MARDAEDRAYVEYVKRSLNEEEEFHFQRFEFLQRLNLAQLQVKLVRLKSKIQASKCASEEDLVTLQETLHNYGNAIRNYRFLNDHKIVDTSEARKRKLLLQRFFKSSLDHGDPFQSHFTYFEDAEATIHPLRRALMRMLPGRLAFSPEERTQRAREYREGKLPMQASKTIDRLASFLVAVAGGAFLIVTMLIMTLGGPSLNTSLVTVSVAVLVFALVLAFAVRGSNAETMVATATYAAVLVVFVGISLGSASQ